MTNKSGNATMILLIIALVVGIASTMLIIAITRTNPKTQSSAAAPVTTTLLPSVPKSTASGQTTFKVPSTGLGLPTATASGINSGLVSTATALSADHTQLAVDFIASSFTSINNITYTITYTAGATGTNTPKSIQGTFAVAGTLITGYKSTGAAYIRKMFTLGTCSGTACVYDTNPRTFAVNVTTD